MAQVSVEEMQRDLSAYLQRVEAGETLVIHTKLIHEGHYAAEVEVELIDADEGWSPYLSLEDAEKLDAVRKALRRGDLKRASQLARVFQLMPVNP